MGALLLVESNTTGTGRLFAQRARHLGAVPVLIAADPDRYPYHRTDDLAVLRADTSDPAALAEAVRQLTETPIGVTSSSEYYLPVAARLAADLNLPGPDPVAVTRCRNKAEQRSRLARDGVPQPEYAIATTATEAVSAAERIGWPVVVKPAEGSGSVGVLRCTDAGQVAEHAGTLLARTHNERGLPIPRQVLVERCVDGPEYSVEVFGHTAITVVGKHLGPAPYFVETGHDVPATLSATDEALLRSVAQRAVVALGLGFGAAHVEIRLGRSGPALMEVNPRLAGGMIPELVRAATGIDLVTAQVAVALGRQPSLTPDRSRFASLRFLTATVPSVVTAAPAELPGVRSEFYRRQGEQVNPAHDFRDRLGHVLAVADSADAARELVDAGLDRLRLGLRPSVEVHEPVPR